MPGAIGGIGQQVADNLFELGKSTVKAGTDAGKKIAEGTIEQLTGAPSSAGAQTQDKQASPESANKERERAQRRQEESRRYQEVKADLERYQQRKKRQDEQIQQERAAEKQQTDRKEAVEKQEKDSWIDRIMKRTAGGAHGETSRQKE